jgi:hypothetical protein
VNPFLSRELAGEHILDLREEAARAGWRRNERANDERDRRIRIRRFGDGDIDGVRRLAELDDKPVPTGGVLVAELDDELVAALPLDGEPALADPFKPTAEIVALLELRARQLRQQDGDRGRSIQGSLRRLAHLRSHTPVAAVRRA